MELARKRKVSPVGMSAAMAVSIAIEITVAAVLMGPVHGAVLIVLLYVVVTTDRASATETTIAIARISQSFGVRVADPFRHGVIGMVREEDSGHDVMTEMVVTIGEMIKVG